LVVVIITFMDYNDEWEDNQQDDLYKVRHTGC